MIYLIFFGICFIIIFSIWYAKKVGKTTDYSNYKSIQSKKIDLIDTTEDAPISFGYKNMWFAIKTDNQLAVAEILGLRSLTQSNWKSGIENAYSGSIFITPAVDNWILAVGLGLPSGDTKESLDIVKKYLKKLSEEFEEAHFFCTHRIVEYHCWVKSTNGEIDRLYSYLGESGENVEILGEPTEAEKVYELVNTFSEEAIDDTYWDREDLTIPDEELVMEIANEWSIDPTKLEEQKDINGLGLLGRRN